MKKMVSKIVVSVVLLAGICSALAQVQQVLPITDQADLRNYALSQGVRGTRYVSSPSIDWDWPGNFVSLEATGANAEQVLDKLCEANFQYRLTNPNDTVSGYIYVYDAKDNLLFFGRADYEPGEKCVRPQFKVWMMDVPLLTNVKSAEILALDENKATVKVETLRVDGGSVFFPPWRAGAPNGILVVRFNDGQVLSYNLANPFGVAPGTQSTAEASYKIDGHYVLDDQPVLKIIEPWLRPTALIRLTQAMTVTIDVAGIVYGKELTYERPYAAEITFNGTTYKVPLHTDVPTVGKLESGEYRIKFLWQNFGQPDMIYTGPVDGNGKG